jgi:hypothetical protein
MMNGNMEQKHSGLGIASFIMSITVCFLIFVMIVIAGILASHRVEGERMYPGQMLVGFGIIFLLIVDVIAVLLGIASVCQSDRKKLFGVLGLAISGLTVLGTLALIALGLMVAHAHQAG